MNEIPLLVERDYGLRPINVKMDSEIGPLLLFCLNKDGKISSVTYKPEEMANSSQWVDEL